MMEIRYSANPADVKRYTTEELRREFQIERLFTIGKVTAVYSHVDRMVTLGIQPAGDAVPIDQGIDCWKNLGTHYFLERREAGIFNIGGPGRIVADKTEYALGFEDCLYLGMETREVSFASLDETNPAKFYLVSAPAHKPCQSTFISLADASKKPCGAAETANRRVINQFIHPDVLETCQLSMGLTCLEPGSVWNTMPAHTHERRMEIYLYFNLPSEDVVFHLMGQGKETRHIVMHNEQAVISPSWSIHAGCGTASYHFIWAMGGENKAFDDMDGIATSDLR